LIFIIILLKYKIKELQAESDLPQEVADKIEQANQELEESGIVDGLKEGTEAPNFKLPDQLGSQVTLPLERVLYKYNQ